MEQFFSLMEHMSDCNCRVVARMLNSGIAVDPETFPSVTIYFSHLQDFDDITAVITSPTEMAGILNSFYLVCDAVIQKMDVYKVETIRDAYMASSIFHRLSITASLASLSHWEILLLNFASQFVGCQRSPSWKQFQSRRGHLGHGDYADEESDKTSGHNWFTSSLWTARGNQLW